MVVLPSWFLPGPPWWYSPRGFSLALHGGTPLVVSPWPSVVVLPSWFLSGPPWWYSCRGFSLALRDGTTYLALFVTSGWPFLMVPMVLPYGPYLALLRSVSLAVPRSPSS
jgi:hypothetical protein